MYKLDEFMAELERKNPAQPEFIQAAREVVASVIDLVNKTPKYLNNKILDRIVEPERVVQFRVEWEDDKHQIQVNRGYRVQFNSAIGPYSRTHLQHSRWAVVKVVQTSIRPESLTTKSCASAAAS